MFPGQWNQQPSGWVVAGGNGRVDADLASRMQTLAMGGGLEESIFPSARSATTSHSLTNNNNNSTNITFPVDEAQGNTFEGVESSSVLSSSAHHAQSMVGPHSSSQDDDFEVSTEGAPDASSLSTLSHQGESKPVENSTAEPFRRPVGEVADLCRAPLAAFLMHRHDTPAFIGLKGCKVSKLKHTSGAKVISVCNDRVYEVDGRKLVLVQLRGHPASVHKAVQITESSFEIFPAPPGAAAVDAEPAAARPSKKAPSPKSPRAMGCAPPSAIVRSPFGSGQPRRQGPIRVVSPDTANATRTAPRPLLLLKAELPTALSETEVSADSESIDRWPASRLELLEFCRGQAACLRGSPEEFVRWLLSQDVESLPDLLEAVNDDDFREEMQANGLKGFKKSAFKKSIQSVVGLRSVAGRA